jgi:orotidine-5'-phosphate decarboxylase
VSVLTGISEDILKNDLKIQIQINEYILHLAMLAYKNGLDGIICSGGEAKLIRENTSSDFLIVTPGVRPSWAKKHDQERIATPKEAILNGASHIVVGRPITEAKDPLDAVKKILDEIEEAKTK